MIARAVLTLALLLPGCGKAPLPSWVGDPYQGRDASDSVCADASSDLADASMARIDAETSAKNRLADQIEAHVGRILSRQADLTTQQLSEVNRNVQDLTLRGLRYEQVYYYPNAAEPERVYVLACVPAPPIQSRVAGTLAAQRPARSDIPDLQQPLKTGAQASADAALVLGIEDYFVLPTVPYALRDADAFYSYLLYTRGLPQRKIQLLRGTPSKEQMLTGLQAAVAAVEPGGTLWVYYAGHGAASPVDGGRLLLGADVQPDARSMDARGLAVAEIIQQISGSAASRGVLVLDTCYSGAGRDGTALLPGKRFAVPSYVSQQAPKVMVWSATSANELSGPLEGAKQGLFTYVALGALRGWADGEISGEPDGAVTLDEAQAYTSRLVSRLSGQQQRPSLVGEAAGGQWTATQGEALEAAPDLSVVVVAP